MYNEVAVVNNSLEDHIFGKIGSSTFYLGDVLEVLCKVPDNSVDIIVTSPPYANRRKNTYGGIDENKYVEWFIPIAKEVKRVLKPTGSFFLNIKPHTKKSERVLYVFDLVLALKRDVGFRFVDEFTWTKIAVPGKFNGRFKNAFEPVYHFTISSNFTHNPYAVATNTKDVSLKRYKRKACGESRNGSGMAGMRKEITDKLALPSNHLHIPQTTNQNSIEKDHSAVFPVGLPLFFIKAYSNEGDVVMDIFNGSGTTAEASEMTNRIYYGIDHKIENNKLSIERIKLYKQKNGDKFLW